MRASTFVNLISLTVCMACLVLGYMQQGYWFIIPVVVGILITWIVARKMIRSWLLTTIFCVCILFAVLGLIMDLSGLLMFIVTISSLVSWDLTLFRGEITENQASHQTKIMEKQHISMLVIMGVSSLALFIVYKYNKIQMSFGLILVLALIAISSLAIGIKRINKQ